MEKVAELPRVQGNDTKKHKSKRAVPPLVITVPSKYYFTQKTYLRGLFRVHHLISTSMSDVIKPTVDKYAPIHPDPFLPYFN